MTMNNRTQFSRLVNFCFNCQANNVEFDKFHFLLQTKQCAQFPSSYNESSCTYWFHIGGMISNSSAAKPYICYCPEYDKYGTECDAYTAFFNEFGLIFSPFVLIAACIGMIVAVIGLVMLPECFHYFQGVPRSATCLVKFSTLFQIRLLGVYFMVLGYVLIICEQVHIYIVHNYDLYATLRGVTGIFGALGA